MMILTQPPPSFLHDVILFAVFLWRSPLSLVDWYYPYHGASAEPLRHQIRNNLFLPSVTSEPLYTIMTNTPSHHPTPWYDV